MSKSARSARAARRKLESLRRPRRTAAVRLLARPLVARERRHNRPIIGHDLKDAADRFWQLGGRPVPNPARPDAALATSSSSRSAGSITVSYIAQVTRLRGGGGSISIRFQLRSGSGSLRGRLAKSPDRRRLRKQTCQLKIEQARAMTHEAMWRMPFRRMSLSRPCVAKTLVNIGVSPILGLLVFNLVGLGVYPSPSFLRAELATPQSVSMEAAAGGSARFLATEYTVK